MLTLCSCGMNKTSFHYACLLQWTAHNETCPSCRHELLWEETSAPAAAGLEASDLAAAIREQRREVERERSGDGGDGEIFGLGDEDYEEEDMVL